MNRAKIYLIIGVVLGVCVLGAALDSVLGSKTSKGVRR